MTAVKIVLEPDARESLYRPGHWQAILVCPLKRWRDRPAWIGPSNYLSREVALQGAQMELDRLERETWMGEH